jgi:hypothetical protein
VVGGAIAAIGTSTGKKAISMTKDSASFTKAAALQVRQDAEKARADREQPKAPKAGFDDTPVDLDALLAMADAELDGKLSDKILTLLNRCTADEAKPPPQDAIRGLSDTVGRQSAEARAVVVEWLRRRMLNSGNALVTHKSLITLRVLLENAGSAVKAKLTENGLILADLEALTKYDAVDPVAGDKPAEMVRDAAVSLLRLAQQPEQPEATAAKAKAGASKFGRLGMRKSKAALEKANEKASGLRASVSAAAGVAGAGSPRPSVATIPDSLTPSAEEGIPTESPDGEQSMPPNDPGGSAGGGEVATPEPDA